MIAEQTEMDERRETVRSWITSGTLHIGVRPVYEPRMKRTLFFTVYGPSRQAITTQHGVMFESTEATTYTTALVNGVQCALAEVPDAPLHMVTDTMPSEEKRMFDAYIDTGDEVRRVFDRWYALTKPHKFSKEELRMLMEKMREGEIAERAEMAAEAASLRLRRQLPPGWRADAPLIRHIIKVHRDGVREASGYIHRPCIDMTGIPLQPSGIYSVGCDRMSLPDFTLCLGARQCGEDTVSTIIARVKEEDANPETLQLWMAVDSGRDFICKTFRIQPHHDLQAPDIEKFAEDVERDSMQLPVQYLVAALQLLVDTPDYLIEERPKPRGPMKKSEKPWTRTDLPVIRLMSIKETRKTKGESQGGTHASPIGHDRRACWKTLLAPRYYAYPYDADTVGDERYTVPPLDEIDYYAPPIASGTREKRPAVFKQITQDHWVELAVRRVFTKPTWVGDTEWTSPTGAQYRVIA